GAGGHHLSDGGQAGGGQPGAERNPHAVSLSDVCCLAPFLTRCQLLSYRRAARASSPPPAGAAGVIGVVPGSGCGGHRDPRTGTGDSSEQGEAPVIVVAGEALIDLVPDRRGDALSPLLPARGGGPFNTAIALSRLGSPTAFCS